MEMMEMLEEFYKPNKHSFMTEQISQNLQTLQEPVTNPWSFAKMLMSQLGTNIIFAIVLGFAAMRMYEDNSRTNEARYKDLQGFQLQLFSYLQDKAKAERETATSQSEMAKAFDVLAKAIDKIAEEARVAHNSYLKSSPKS